MVLSLIKYAALIAALVLLAVSIARADPRSPAR
jgi:hypothetical protein